MRQPPILALGIAPHWSGTRKSTGVTPAFHRSFRRFGDNQGMSRTSLILAAAAVFALSGGRVVADTVLFGSVADALIPSAAPALLGPITSAGRKSWDCKPEHVAASLQIQDSGLPTTSDR